MSKVNLEKVDVLDLIIDVLREHEKKLDELVERLERLNSKELERFK